MTVGGACISRMSQGQRLGIVCIEMTSPDTDDLPWTGVAVVIRTVAPARRHVGYDCLKIHLPQWASWVCNRLFNVLVANRDAVVLRLITSV